MLSLLSQSLHKICLGKFSLLCSFPVFSSSTIFTPTHGVTRLYCHKIPVGRLSDIVVKQ